MFQCKLCKYYNGSVCISVHTGLDWRCLKVQLLGLWLVGLQLVVGSNTDNKKELGVISKYFKPINHQTMNIIWVSGSLYSVQAWT